MKQVQTLGGVDYVVERRFDAGGRLRGITYPDGDAVGTPSSPLGYDQAGRLTSIPGIVTEVLSLRRRGQAHTAGQLQRDAHRTRLLGHQRLLDRHSHRRAGPDPGPHLLAGRGRPPATGDQSIPERGLELRLRRHAPVPGVGPVQVDWFTDIKVGTRVWPVSSASAAYMGGKMAWSASRAATGAPIGNTWPFQDPGETNAMIAVSRGLGYADIFTPELMAQVCPQ